MRVQHEASHLQTALELVVAGLGATILPLVPGRQGIACRPLEPAPPAMEFAFVYREDLSPDSLREILRLARGAVRTVA
jgi:DNA-binding transcriptional LysR family regulator